MRSTEDCARCRESDGFQPLYDPEICADCPDLAEAEAIERELKSDDVDTESTSGSATAARRSKNKAG